MQFSNIYYLMQQQHIAPYNSDALINEHCSALRKMGREMLSAESLHIKN